ncbi:PQQ-dependent sugar dehydrogenase [Streptomyces benahoarensis]|uniref:PQQ-dependent sugar dehydrogenase n=1 Tax=Streptomyces benahoarensis TaxID=2595054 RepID=A0A553ZK45_9ACTN|nr:PQQ-dependent sugar dehydrogenase [Streptomyces benahoarensis]TSB21952.1 PQQ-dependent sugar dehydrogenase [Streptomyces benahoarensis]TSB41849.1 PQQ-dependent sugar dehydrogenase [Streptomyces benahoarensis]
MPHRLPTAVTAAAALLLAAGCSAHGNRPAPGAPSPERSAAAVTGPQRDASPPPAKGSAKVTRTLATGLNSPWGVAALPGGDLLVGSRDKRTLTRVSARDGHKTEVGSVPGVAPGGEGGLLGLAVSPSFRGDHLVYAYFTTASDNRIARMSYDDTRHPGDQLGAPHTVLRSIPKGHFHNGGRIAFGPDRMLYASTGETGDKDLSQDKKSTAGKILRMTPDGAPARGNPDPRSVVYSYGHRNVEGLAWDSGKRLWASEFGEDTWDELNLIEPGRNYGWPAREGKGPTSGRYVNPVLQWKPADASPSGLAYAKGSLWMAALRGERLWRIPLNGAKPAAAPQAFFTGRHGRLRTVLPADHGALWLVTSNTDGRGQPRKGDDRILRVEVS